LAFKFNTLKKLESVYKTTFVLSSTHLNEKIFDFCNISTRVQQTFRLKKSVTGLLRKLNKIGTTADQQVNVRTPYISEDDLTAGICVAERSHSSRTIISPGHSSGTSEGTCSYGFPLGNPKVWFIINIWRFPKVHMNSPVRGHFKQKQYCLMVF